MSVRKIPVLAGIVLLAAGVIAPVFGQHASGFRAPGEGEWYHPIEVDKWVSLGGDRAVMETTLDRIKSATGERADDAQPDSLIAYGPGHWTFEWAQIGQAALDKAKSAKSRDEIKSAAQQSIIYFTIASSPHTHDPNNRAALSKASEAYLLAGAQIPETIKEVEIAHAGDTFKANFHLPVGEGPLLRPAPNLNHRFRKACRIPTGAEEEHRDVSPGHRQNPRHTKGPSITHGEQLAKRLAKDQRSNKPDKKRHCTLPCRKVFWQGCSDNRKGCNDTKLDERQLPEPICIFLHRTPPASCF